MAETSVDALVARLEKGRRKTRETLAGLAADQWQTPIYPDPRWTARGLLAHFVSA